LTNLLGWMPKDLKLILILGKIDTVKNFYKGIKNKYNLIYYVGRNKETKIIIIKKPMIW